MSAHARDIRVSRVSLRSRGLHALQSRLRSQLSHDRLAKAVDHPFAAKRDQHHLAALAGLETHGCASCDVEAHAACLLALEFQRRIGFEEMIVRADLNRPIAGIGDRQRYCLASTVELDLTFLDEFFAGNHVRLRVSCRSHCRRATHASPPLSAGIAASGRGIRGTPKNALRFLGTPSRPYDGGGAHLIGSCTVTSFVPSGNVASTWIS